MTTDEPFDAIIVGQGLAGTTLAWHLHDAGQRVLIIDRDEAVTSSKIAAGLITPITGQRLTLSPRYDTYFPAAQDFYARIAERTGRRFFHERTTVRLLATPTEASAWSQRRLQKDFQAHLVAPQPSPLIDPDIASAALGGFAMQGAQLDVAAYLDASKAVLPFAAMTLDWQRDVTLGTDEISVKGLRTRRLISCEGYAATRNPYFQWVPFRAAKGDILTVRFHAPMPPLSLHRGVWIAPTADQDVFRVGATYDWDTLDQVPSAAARDEIERKLQECVRLPYTVLDHQAAVRPIIHESNPRVGVHPAHARLGYFNGLGSKGSLLAPWCANAFAAFLVHGTPLPVEVNVARFWRDKSPLLKAEFSG